MTWSKTGLKVLNESVTLCSRVSEAATICCVASDGAAMTDEQVEAAAICCDGAAITDEQAAGRWYSQNASSDGGTSTEIGTGIIRTTKTGATKPFGDTSPLESSTKTTLHTFRSIL
jgi:hypothetical protein